MQIDELIKTILAVLGAITGTVALGWRVVDEFGSFLRISLKVDPPRGGWMTALTAIENKGNRSKPVSYAMLLIGPESESPIKTAKILATQAGYEGQIRDTNDLELFVVHEVVAVGGRRLIPLPFYYSENIDIADEGLTYRAAINIENFAPATPYAIRFFVFAAGWLHRSTHDAIVIEKSE
jgi:hypothetical protein